MTPDQIAHLIAARNAITDRTDEYPNWQAVDEIDAVLRDVPPGNDEVDRLLGRRVTDFSRAAFQRNVIARRHGDMTGIGWPLQQIVNTINDTREAERARVQASVTMASESLADWMAEIWPTLPEIAY